MEYTSHYWLYLLILIPFFLLLKRMISGALSLKYFFLSLSFACVVLALAGPYYPGKQPVRKFLFIFDISRSMTVRDMKNENGAMSRLEFARDKLAQAVPFLPPATHVGVGGAITSYYPYDKDSNIKIFWPIQELTEENAGAFYKALGIADWWNAWGDKSQWPAFLSSFAWLVENKLGRDLNIVIFSDGGSGDISVFGGEAIAGSRLIFEKNRTRLIFLGVGGDIAEMVPEFNEELKPTGKCFADGDGKCFLTRLEEENMKRVAKLSGGSYVRLQSLEDLMSVLKDPQNRVSGSENIRVNADRKFLFSALFFIILFFIL